VLGFCVSLAVDLKQTNFFVVVLEDHTDSIDSLSFVVYYSYVAGRTNFQSNHNLKTKKSLESRRLLQLLCNNGKWKVEGICWLLCFDCCRGF
jgi:hypothetical protein